jgi:hypothetical protein
MEDPVPFCGRMSYCYSTWLKMILDWKGDQYPLAFLECPITVPFGFVYVAVAEEKGGFAINGFNPHVGIRRALEALGYRHGFRWFEDGDQALSYLRLAQGRGNIGHTQADNLRPTVGSIVWKRKEVINAEGSKWATAAPGSAAGLRGHKQVSRNRLCRRPPENRSTV